MRIVLTKATALNELDMAFCSKITHSIVREHIL